MLVVPRQGLEHQGIWKSSVPFFPRAADKGIEFQKVPFERTREGLYRGPLPAASRFTILVNFVCAHHTVVIEVQSPPLQLSTKHRACIAKLRTRSLLRARPAWARAAMTIPARTNVVTVYRFLIFTALSSFYSALIASGWPFSPTWKRSSSAGSTSLRFRSVRCAWRGGS